MINKEIHTGIIENLSLDSMATPTVLVLDLDLTLHNVVAHYEDSVNSTLLHFGFSELTHEEICKNFVCIEDSFAKIMPAHLVKQAMEYYINHFLLREIPANSLFPGVKELLSLVKRELNLPIVAVTNSEEIVAHKILSDLGVLEFFDFVAGVKEGNIPKPDKQMLILALDAVSATPGPHVWLVGDSYSDTECAKNSGCTAIRYYHKNKPIDENADLFINCYYNLFAMMKVKCGKIS